MIRPLISYGAIIWAHRIKPNNSQLLRLQRLSLLSLGHFPKSIPTRGLDVATNLLPLDLYVKEHAEKNGTTPFGKCWVQIHNKD